MLGIQDSVSKEPSRTAIPVADDSDTNIAVSFAAERKIALFRSLFRGREDVYAVRWEVKNGKSGYSPDGVTDWRAIHAARPEDRKKVARKTRMLQPLTDKAIRNHLIGKLTIGSTHSCRTRLVGSLQLISTRPPGLPMPQLLPPRVDGFTFQPRTEESGNSSQVVVI
jgi:hypothetical protein